METCIPNSSRWHSTLTNPSVNKLQLLVVPWEHFSCLIVVNHTNSTAMLKLFLKARWAVVSKAQPCLSDTEDSYNIILMVSALGIHPRTEHIPLEGLPYMRAGKEEAGKCEWCLFLLILQHFWGGCTFPTKNCIFRTPQWAAQFTWINSLLTQTYFSWENSFHEATKWHCCSVVP